MAEIMPDMNCVPSRRKVLWPVRTLPVALLVSLVLVWPWTAISWLPSVLLAGRRLTSTFQTFCCADQELRCVGRFCPATPRIILASPIATALCGEPWLCTVEGQVRGIRRDRPARPAHVGLSTRPPDRQTGRRLAHCTRADLRHLRPSLQPAGLSGVYRSGDLSGASAHRQLQRASWPIPQFYSPKPPAPDHKDSTRAIPLPWI